MKNSLRTATAMRPTDDRWERSYFGHVFRDRLDRAIARVTRVGRPVNTYAWQTSGCRGAAKSLRLAKALVEEAIRRNVQQGELFDSHE